MTRLPCPLTPYTQKTPAQSAKTSARAQMKGRPSMSQTTAPPIPAKDSANTTRAALVLASLTAAHSDLPGLHWSVTPYLSLGGNCPANEVEPRVRQVAAWSLALDVPVLVSVAHTRDLATASASTVVDGVRVDVWSVVYPNEGETPAELATRVRRLVITAGGEVA